MNEICNVCGIRESMGDGDTCFECWEDFTLYEAIILGEVPRQDPTIFNDHDRVMAKFRGMR